MKKKIHKLVESTRRLILHPLFSGSAVMILGTNLANGVAYLYHLVFGRILGPAEYGELASMISLLGLFMVTFNFFGTVIVKFISTAKSSEAEKLLAWFIKKTALLGFLVGLMTFISSGAISKFLHVEQRITLLMGPILFFSFLALVFRSFLQGQMKFVKVAILANADLIGRLILGLLFIFLGLSVFGAILGLLLAIMITLVMGRMFTSKYKIFKTKDSFNGGGDVLKYAIPLFFASLSINSFFSTDLILVKHFFEANEAGIYASLSTLGKIIFFGASPVSAVMFPMISKRHSKGYGFKKIFAMSMLMSALIAGGVLFVYLFFPKIAISMLYGSKYLEAAPYLFSMGVFMSVFTLSTLVINYYLSQGKTKVVTLIVVAAAVQAVGIWLNHDTIVTVITVSIISASLLFGSLLIYFGYDAKKISKSSKAATS